ncbi:hypothetical protein M8C21_018404 [Ambrosia artemisiifolia]|uniref:Ubiquitin-like protease family profile domain-containing protein n=1 Tax=Ambrosia artemisiifolia TaxID=4212 RepID=A0AAD5BQI4_AMBAR|nr:hypothetical protein M8C21_018404 [Ambrosia artemisiifolia]
MSTTYPSKKFESFEFECLPDEKNRWPSAQPSTKTKFRCVDSAVDKYNMLQSFAIAIDTKGKKPMDERLIVHDVDERVNERISRSGAALQSSSSNYNSKTLSQSKCTDYFTSCKAATDRKDSDSSQRLHLVDNEFVSIISDDEDIDNSSTMSSDALEDAEGLSEEWGLVDEVTSQDKESSVVVSLECITYGRNCYSKAQLTFFRSSIKLDVSEEGAIGCLTFEWKTLNLISIESRWLDPLKTAEVCLRIKSEHSQKSGVLEVKFTVPDPCWSTKQDRIKSLDAQYKEKWDVDLDSYELFEDITYLEGGGDSIAISKSDFQLLQPEKYLKKIKPADAIVHFFNSFFFRKLVDFDENQSRSIDFKEAFQRVRKWTKKVDVFQKDYIYIPVNFRLHWSLIIICHPGEVVNFTDDEIECSQKVPCILHMDSIKGHHRGLEHCIKGYLWEEWKERNNDASKDISKKIMDLRFIRLEVPQQENSYDCGLFMLHYMELFVKQASNNFNPLNNFISTDWFYPIEASLKRARIKRLIFELIKSNAQKVTSPKLSYELKDEDDDEEEADVQILDETCNAKETCESISDTCVNNSRDDTPLVVKPLKSGDMDINISDSDIDRGSLIADGEQKNHGQIVLYDPSICAMSPTKKTDETEDSVDKQIVIVPETNNTNPVVNHINESMNSLQLKEKSGGDGNVFEPHVVEDSDDDVFETHVVEDSGSDSDSAGFFICDVNNNHQKASSSSSSVFKDVAECGLNRETSKTRQRSPLVFGPRKRRRRSR